jgi:hypothetical protein
VPEGGPNYDFAQIVAPGTEPKIHSIFDFTAESLEQLAFWLEQRGLHIPVTQLLGYSQTTPKVATDVATAETTISAAYTDLATTGPSLTGLSDGVYQVSFGARMFGTVAGQLVLMSLSPNGAAAVDGDSIQSDATANFQSSMRQVVYTLTNGGNNTITTKYKVTGGTGTFGYRFLHALRVGNA